MDGGIEKTRRKERKRYEEERKQADERYQEVLRRRGEAERRQKDDRKRYEELIKEVTEVRKKRIEVVGPESLKLTKLGDSEDVKVNIILVLSVGFLLTTSIS